MEEHEQHTRKRHELPWQDNRGGRHHHRVIDASLRVIIQLTQTTRHYLEHYVRAAALNEHTPARTQNLASTINWLRAGLRNLITICASLARAASVLPNANASAAITALDKNTTKLTDWVNVNRKRAATLLNETPPNDTSYTVQLMWTCLDKIDETLLEAAAEGNALREYWRLLDASTTRTTPYPTPEQDEPTDEESQYGTGTRYMR